MACDQFFFLDCGDFGGNYSIWKYLVVHPDRICRIRDWNGCVWKLDFYPEVLESIMLWQSLSEKQALVFVMQKEIYIFGGKMAYGMSN